MYKLTNKKVNIFIIYIYFIEKKIYFFPLIVFISQNKIDFN